MNRTKQVFLTVMFLFAMTALMPSAFAQEKPGVPVGGSVETQKAMGHEAMEHMGKMDWDQHKMMARHMGEPMMMKGMMEKTMVATSDGGVIVLAGNKLMKYDKDLNLVKEVEIKIDVEAMQKQMAEMMKNCPMMKERMEDDRDELEKPNSPAVEEGAKEKTK